ncbi:hypothetical protein K492DRAFT_225786 [Lichtheimia hyalospora FSU 10163]|nr:hypothetical protein K492DRAFT_225786 [Lichtheimia hyalospora FSU 10163]
MTKTYAFFIALALMVSLVLAGGHYRDDEGDCDYYSGVPPPGGQQPPPGGVYPTGGTSTVTVTYTETVTQTSTVNGAPTGNTGNDNNDNDNDNDTSGASSHLVGSILPVAMAVVAAGYHLA